MRRRYKPARPPGKTRIKKRTKSSIAAFALFSLIVMGAAVFLGAMNKRLLPAVLKIEEYRINSRLNQAIDESVKAMGANGGLLSSDFYHITADADGKISSLSANTMLINEICANLSHFIGIFLSKGEVDYISVPIGVLLGIEWLANTGPSYKISVMPIGACNVSYETSFKSAGINQINFQVWLNISTAMQVINPIQTTEITVTRNIALVNTVFTGEIPGAYINVPGSLY